MDIKKLVDIVEQLNSCEFECEAGPLFASQAFVDLARMASHTFKPSKDDIDTCERCGRNIRNLSFHRHGEDSKSRWERDNPDVFLWKKVN
jgi:hypothetical protein